MAQNKKDVLFFMILGGLTGWFLLGSLMESQLGTSPSGNPGLLASVPTWPFIWAPLGHSGPRARLQTCKGKRPARPLKVQALRVTHMPCSTFHWSEQVTAPDWAFYPFFFFFLVEVLLIWGASQVARVVKNPPANAGDVRDAGSIPGWGRSPGEGNGNPLQYSCLENPMDRRTWWAAVHGVAKSWTGLKWLSMHTRTHIVGLQCFRCRIIGYYKTLNIVPCAIQ